MKITYEVEIHPFNVPNFVVPVSKAGFKQDGIVIKDGVPLSELSQETLRHLCEDFTNAVFDKAGYCNE